MTAKRLDGKALAATMRSELATRIATRTNQGKRPPGLAVVLIGDNEASVAYVRNKRKACADVGIFSRLDHLPTTTTEAELLQLLALLNHDPAIHGILVQLPLPVHISEEAVIHAVHPSKDVDAFHPENLGLLFAGHPRFLPCTPTGCIELMRRNGYTTEGKEVVVIGRSNIVGKPLALMLMQRPTVDNPYGGDATVTVAHSRTPDLATVCRRADVLIAAVGKAHLITSEMVKPGAVVVDVGTNAVSGKLVGDVHPDVEQVATALSPVPGGVGPMTIMMLLENTFRAAVLIDG